MNSDPKTILTNHRDPPLTPERPKIPRSIWALGFVSLFMDISSEMIHALLPVFMVTVLGASMVTVGLIEGIAEATASISKLFSGWLSDKLGRHKMLTVIGYGLSTFSKPLFAIAPTISWVFFARFSDRIGKGIRGAPRDSLIRFLTPTGVRGAAYGLRQSFDATGAFIGPILAMVLMALSSNNFRLIFWLAVIPGLIAVAILIIGVRNPVHNQDKNSDPLLATPKPSGALVNGAAHGPVRWNKFGTLGRLFWGVVGVGTLLTLARFSEAFLILRAQGMGLSFALLPMVLVVMNVVYAVLAYPMGVLSDNFDKQTLLIGGFIVLIAADITLALAPNIWVVMVGVALWGLHMGMTQSLLITLVSQTIPPSLCGTAFGVFHLVTGVALLVASVIAGLLWDMVGPSATFIGGATFATISLFGLITIGLIQRNEERS